jgi:hypothetical protein
LCVSNAAIVITIGFSKQRCSGVASDTDIFSGELVGRDTNWKTTIFVRTHISAIHSMLAYAPPVEPVQRRSTYFQRSKLPLFNGDE